MAGIQELCNPGERMQCRLPGVCHPSLRDWQSSAALNERRCSLRLPEYYSGDPALAVCCGLCSLETGTGTWRDQPSGGVPGREHGPVLRSPLLSRGVNIVRISPAGASQTLEHSSFVDILVCQDGYNQS